VEYALVAAVALIAAGLTLFSGFGLGTLLLPAFAAFFPPEVAIGATAVVHFANNCFKLVLVGRGASGRVVVRFGLPAVGAAVVGALLLERLASQRGELAAYTLAGREFEVTPLGLVVGALIVCFAAIEWLPGVKRLKVPPKYLPVGGVLSGFFGGLSGHQGALRSAFLIRSGLDRDQFIGTTAVCSALVDFTRLTVYAIGAILAGGLARESDHAADLPPLIAVGCAAAFVGSFAGARLVKKITLAWLQAFVAVTLVLFGLAMAAGAV
jgi:uncharacterized membrane protein YfcA